MEDFHSEGANLRNISVPAQLYPDWLLHPRQGGKVPQIRLELKALDAPFLFTKLYILLLTSSVSSSSSKACNLALCVFITAYRA